MVQGKFEARRRNYSAIWQEMERHLAGNEGLKTDARQEGWRDMHPCYGLMSCDQANEPNPHPYVILIHVAIGSGQKFTSKIPRDPSVTSVACC